MVEDMLSLEFWKLWSQTAMRNRAIFEKIFRCVGHCPFTRESELTSSRSLTMISDHGKTMPPILRHRREH